MIRTFLTALLCTSTLAFAADMAKPKAADAKDKKGKNMIAVVKTNKGTFKFKLLADDAPNTVANFVGLAEGTKEWTDPKTNKKVKRPLYNGTIFHRVIPGFMIQGGDPTGTGMGDPGYKNPTERSPTLRHDKPGVVAMANAGADTDGCQFYVMTNAYPSLDVVRPPSKGYSIFGQVIEGQSVVDEISKVKTNRDNRPEQEVKIESIKIEPLSELLNSSASTPNPSIFSRWSFIKEIRGETTTVVPGKCSAGSW